MNASLKEPAWLVLARADIGQRETLAPNDSPWLRRMWAGLSGSWLLGQPWCGGAVAHWMSKAGFEYPRTYYRAKDWLKWGESLDVPVVGAVVVFDRAGGGHVGLVVGKDARGRLMVIGGNQGDSISEAPFDMGRVLGYRWPTLAWSVVRRPLPVLTASGASSSNEA